MKKITKVLALMLVCISVASLFAGCSSDELKFIDAVTKSQEINSMEAKENISIKMNVSGLSEEEQQKANMVVQMLNNLNITMNEKMTRDPETNSQKAEILSNFTAGGISSNANIWVESNFADGKPVVKEIFQLPPFALVALAKSAPQKDYLVLDTSKVPTNTVDSAPLMDNGSYKDLNKQIIDMTVKLYKNYSKNFKPDFQAVTLKGISGSGFNANTVYELKLTDSTFKKLLSSMVNDLSTNKENLKLIEDYFTAIMKLSTSMNPAAAASQEDVDKLISGFESQIPYFVESYNKYCDALKNVNILGKDGIVVDYTVNNDGYIVKQDSNINIKVDLAELTKAISQVNGMPVNGSGILDLNIKATSEISKINQKVDITLPEITDDNSLDYFTFIQQIIASKICAASNIPDINDAKVNVFVNGDAVKFNNPPLVLKDKTMVPAREIVEALGGTMEWDENTQTVTAKVGSNTASFTMRSPEAIVNGEAVKLDVPALMIFDRVYIPLRTLSDSIGCKLTWDGETSSAYLEN